MSRQINIADNKGRNAEVIFKSYAKKPLVKTTTQKAIEPLPVSKAKTQRRRLSPNTIQEREAVKQSRKAINDLIKKERQTKKDEKLLAKLPIDKNPYFL